jgi:hypothetical protein
MPNRLSLGQAASSSRSGNLVLPPRPGWRDLAGRCWHARPQPQAPTNQPGHPSRPRPGLDKLVRLGVMAEMLLVEARRAPLDQALRRLRDAHEGRYRELADCLTPRPLGS